jgi:hypothetical protein
MGNLLRGVASLALLAGVACYNSGNGSSSGSGGTTGSSSGGSSSGAGSSALLGSFDCTSASQTQTCDGGAGSGTFSLTELVCPIAIESGAANSTLITVHKDGLATRWSITGSMEASLDGPQSYPSFADPLGSGTITEFTLTGGSMAAAGGTLTISEQGTLVLVSDGSWACNFTRSYTGPTP